MNDVRCEDCFFNSNDYCVHPCMTQGSGEEKYAGYAQNFNPIKEITDWLYYEVRVNYTEERQYKFETKFCYKHRYFIKNIILTSKMKEDLLAIESNKIQCRLVEIDNELEKLR